MKKIWFILMLLILQGCGLFKTTAKNRVHTQTHVTEQGVRVVKVPRDSIVYEPRVIHKDTTIVVENKHLILTTTFRNHQVARVKATQKPVEEITRYKREETTDERQKEKHKEGIEFRPVYLLYGFGGLALFFVILMLASALIKRFITL